MIRERQNGTLVPQAAGIYFHILTKQGKNGPGGAKSYIVHGKMTEGFAFLAYPADYRSSGVMTFIVNQDGGVLQKDLGKRTNVLAKAMNRPRRTGAPESAQTLRPDVRCVHPIGAEAHFS